MSTTAVRRLAPLLVALLVLALVVGAVALLRKGRAGWADRPGGGGDGGVLRLADYQPPTANPANDRFHLATTLSDERPDPTAVRRVSRPGAAAVARLAKALHATQPAERGAKETTYTGPGGRLTVTQDGQWQFIGTGVGFKLPGCDIPVPSTAASPGLVANTPVCAQPPPDVPQGGQPDATQPGIGAGDEPTLQVLSKSQRAAALRVAIPVLEAVGADPEGAHVGGVATAVTIVADPRVDDLPTAAFSTAVTVSAGHVTVGGGWVGGTEQGARYPVVSAQQAWQILRRTPMVMPLMACPEPLPGGTDPLTCGGPVTVTGATFGLSLHQGAHGMLLVPSWIFEVRSSPTGIAVVAVDPEHLAALQPAPGGGGSTGSTGSTGTAVPGDPGTGSAEPPVTDPGATPSRFSGVTLEAGATDALHVRFTGGTSACYSYRVVAEESADKVALSLHETVSPTARCDDIAQVYERTVQLRAPLEARRVIDAETGAVLLGPSR